MNHTKKFLFNCRVTGSKRSVPVDSHKKAGLPSNINNDNETASANEPVISYLDESAHQTPNVKRRGAHITIILPILGFKLAGMLLFMGTEVL